MKRKKERKKSDRPVQGDGRDAQGGDEHRDRRHQGQHLTQDWLWAPRPETDILFYFIYNHHHHKRNVFNTKPESPAVVNQ